MKRPLASHLIRRVLPVYLAFAAAMTLVQIVLEYLDTQAAVLQEIESTASAFEPAVADALWNYQLYLLPQLAQVIVAAGAVTGVDIGADGQLFVTRAQDVAYAGKLSKRVELFHEDADGTRVAIGHIALYSGPDVVIQRVKLGALLIVAGSAVMTVGLWLIVIFFVNRLLAAPLRHFTAQIASIDPARTLTAPSLDVGPEPSIELAYLRDTFVDLAQRAVHSRRLSIQKEAAEAANVAKTRFLAAASHDLRQPIHAMNLYLGTLARLDLPELGRELLIKTRACGEAMDEMFRGLLDVSRLDAAAVQPEIETFPIARLLQRLRLQFEPEARAKGLELRVVPCSALVRSDAVMIERIARNLVSNAVRYTQRGTVLVGCRRRGSAIRLAVYDTGPGIPASEQQAVFDEFHQLPPAAGRQPAGMGLGLAIVERLARLLSLPLTLVSRVERGSMFAIDIPRDAVIEVHEAGVAPRAEQDTPRSRLIVVIDDEPAIRDATRALLEQWGCSVITADSSSVALQRLRAATLIPDAVLCDYRLGGLENGLDALGSIRGEFNVDIPALLVTGETSAHHLREVHASGLPVLYKPVDEHALRHALGELLKARTSVSPG